MDGQIQITDYIVTLREKYARSEKSFRVSAVTKGRITKADLNETRVSYTINGAYFLKADLMEFSCSLANSL